MEYIYTYLNNDLSVPIALPSEVVHCSSFLHGAVHRRSFLHLHILSAYRGVSRIFIIGFPTSGLRRYYNRGGEATS